MKKKITVLCILFAAVFCIHGVSGPMFFMYYSMSTNSIVPDALMIRYYMITLAMAALFYLPLAIVINRMAKKAQMQALKFIALAVVIVLGLFLAINAIVIPLVLSIA